MNFPKDQGGVLPAALLAFFCAEDISAKGFAVRRVMVLDDEGLQKKRVHRNFSEGFKGHAEINRRLGDPDYPATRVVDAWLTVVFGW